MPFCNQYCVLFCMEIERLSREIARVLLESIGLLLEPRQWLAGGIFFLSHTVRPSLQAAKLDVPGWRDHILNGHTPYRRDCRRCVGLMGVDSPHRRSHDDSTAYVLSIDIIGPYPIAYTIPETDAALEQNLQAISKEEDHSQSFFQTLALLEKHSDLCGQHGKDVGLDRPGRYVLVGTVPIPKLQREVCRL